MKLDEIVTENQELSYLKQISPRLI